MLRGRFEAPRMKKLLATGFHQIKAGDGFKFSVHTDRALKVFEKRNAWSDQEFDLTGVTVIFQLFNRPHYFGPLFLEFSRLVTGCKFLISDASGSNARAFHKKIIVAARKINPTVDIDYFELDENISAYENLGVLYGKVSTEYCIKFDDDDFLNPAALFEAKKELDQHSGVVAVHGWMLNFNMDENQAVFLPAIRSWANSDDLVENLHLVALQGGVNWQIMSRSDALKRAFSQLSFSTPEAPDMIFDHLFHLYLALDGKIEMTSGIFGLCAAGRDTVVVNIGTSPIIYWTRLIAQTFSPISPSLKIASIKD